MDFLDEDQFNAQFQARLRATRKDLKWSQAHMAEVLEINRDAYKKIEKRPGASFPTYLLPRLAFWTQRPLTYWVGQEPAKLRVIKSA